MQKFVMAALGGTLAGIVATTQFVGPLLAQEENRATSVYEQLDLFGDIFERIRAQYVEQVDEEDLIEAAIDGMLTSLDPHSSYLSPDDAADMRVQTRGEFGGLGIEVTQEDGFVKVVSPIDGTPAEMAGIEAGDFITHVDGESVLGLTLDEAVDMMRGPVGSEIIITVVREGEGEPFDVEIVRDTITLTAVRTRTEGQTVVLRITTFNDQTYPNLEEGLNEQVEALGGMENVNGFVVDLRNNPGGLLTQAIRVSDAFLDAGEIVSTRGRDPQDGDRFNAEEGDLAEGKPIVVLINGGSASASEIVAGALQDHRRAIVVGTKSFGKGSVQTVMPLRGDGAMRLTTARYYTPSGRSIQALGVSPDIVVAQPPRRPESEEDEEASGLPTRTEADLRGSLDNDSLSEDELRQIEEDREKAETAAALREEDYQLAYAIDILKGLSALGPEVQALSQGAAPAAETESE
ncbi:putative CtpA-like serine protease [Roseivivax sp. THAF40]|uniref:S41 family peptidase n=1 Tax=unclassified Roseivivax TaxID=2639302 RepID=UPI00126812B5|nr:MULTISPECIES: S41 family peptidase [unclassified Roseivivax]QFS81317.1 putative CtpA-like serine protease [Roseivivax sp. THAF197b]QFT45046.1 putative CtpA-like serine protease [Roseivivax sp. THAF40]